VSVPRPLAGTVRPPPPLRAVTGARRSERLDERWERMPHTFERRPVDAVLRGLDLALAGTALVVLSPVMAGEAAAIALTSGRPVLYRGLRVGRGGQVFTMLKFRTLRPDAESRLGPFLGEELTRLTDEELSPVGRVLREAHLDELPQLWNVVRGEMSLVGPRPIRPLFFAELTQEIPGYWQRLVVRPGLTGFAQLRLTREMTWAEKLAHDFEYIADRSVRLYLLVLAQTGARVVRRLALMAAGRR
jgi:lipopolysaccharide/colanic/teichoic acid biosynthesis glycosyltransferase